MRLASGLTVVIFLLQACASNPDGRTLADLRHVEPDLQEVAVDDSLDRAMESYRRFLEETSTNAKTPEAMRRLADLQIEKRYGILGTEEPAAVSAGTELELPAPSTSTAPQISATAASVTDESIADLSEADADFEQRAASVQLVPEVARETVEMPDGTGARDFDGPRQAIETYKRILQEYPHYERNDQVLYQMARAYDELGEPDEAMQVMERLINDYEYSEYSDEVYFRRAEYFFVRKKYLDAEESYGAVIAMGDGSEFYELALYKLGWSLYKQELYEDALHQYIALLDYKVSVGYDFGRVSSVGAGPEDSQLDDLVTAAEAELNPEPAESAVEPSDSGTADSRREEDERRVADTFRVISLAFSNLGGPDVLNDYFSDNGNRSYEDRIYSNLGEFYLTKLRYNDAATVYRSFTELNPHHRVAPLFSMRVVEIYEQGDFAQLVVEAKQDFATRYALDAAYWNYFDVDDSPEVLSFLKTNLQDLAVHFHSLYQDEGFVEEAPENYAQALHWYREFLGSFPAEEESPGINYQLADLLLEHQDYAEAALEYEQTAYDYPAHEQSSAAGYAAIFAHRENLKGLDEVTISPARLATVESSLRFANTFPEHEHAATVLGAAAQDLYDMQDFERAIAAGTTLIDGYPGAEVALQRSAWTVVAQSSFDLTRYADAELAYGSVLELTETDDPARQALYDNLAAAIYQQGEAASELEDYRTAADHFLRISVAAPTSEIRPAAEYDAAATLIKLEDWDAAAEVYRNFRAAHTDHELQPEVTKQLAFVYREAGDLVQSADEYVRVADDTADSELRRESLLMAGDLYADAGEQAHALAVFSGYVEEYPHPVDLALEIRFRIAGMYETAGDRNSYHDELRRIVDIDADAGAERTPRTRFLAGKSALVLAEVRYRYFDELTLTLPFADSLAEKKVRMDAALSAFEQLVDYEVAEVTTAATYYMAEIYGHFGTALLDSERPSDLDAAERVEYNLALEAEAFPFEERAIEVHEKNVELMTAGMFDGWVQRSLDELATLMPGRYAKAEISSGFIGPVEIFAYRSPAVEILPSVPANDVSQQMESVSEDAGEEPAAPEEQAEDEVVRDVSAVF
jgi:tetratricopeptide (TPR) repeat protein